MTGNTDFADAEVDERQVNLTRFSIFFPEQRDFFLQDAGIFDFAGRQSGNALPFFSRRVGIGPDGEEVQILAGGKLTGRVGVANIGLFSVWMDDNVIDLLEINTRLRWIIEPGNELFLVFNQQYEVHGSGWRPVSSELISKVAWTFRF